MIDLKKLGKYRGRRAVSPVVATLILIIVAIVGAVAVGLIVSGIGTSTSKGANANGAGTNAQSVIYVGGSTTVFPVTSAGLPAFEQQSHINVQLSQGGSDAGMQGILSGALDVGESSSITAVNKLIVNVQSNNVINVNPVPTLIGGSGVIFGTTSDCGVITAGSCAAVAGTPSTFGATPLYDGTAVHGVACLEISRDALAAMYSYGTFWLATGACTGGQLLDSTLVSSTVTGSGPYVAIGRSDPGGTQDTACGYLNGAPLSGSGALAPAITYSAGQTSCGGAKEIGSGNLGV
ncbi:MAG TPA: substrate-binding domain-containing protein, partial [Nitrososphaerales archaeon]|nr:substrate-binding domain-containing protein [Nitrososphaerales archaeon]